MDLCRIQDSQLDADSVVGGGWQTLFAQSNAKSSVGLTKEPSSRPQTHPTLPGQIVVTAPLFDAAMPMCRGDIIS